MSEFHQIHLAGRGFSGRVVRYVTLSPEEIEQNERFAQSSITPTSTYAQYMAVQTRVGMERMIKQVSDPVIFEPLAAPPGETPEAAQKRLADDEASLMRAIADAVFHEVTPEQLGEPENWKKLFGTRDTRVLMAAYRMEHEVSQTELDAIMGKKVEVIVD